MLLYLMTFILGVPIPQIRTQRGEEARDLVRGVGRRSFRRFRRANRWRPLLLGGGQLLLPAEDFVEVILLRSRRCFRRQVRNGGVKSCAV